MQTFSDSGSRRHMIDILFVLALFCVFAVSCVILIIFGSDIYKKTVTRMDSNYTARTSVAYITEKVRANDMSSAISVIEDDGAKKLIMKREINGLTYTTSLYEYNGYLCELFARADIDFSLDAGAQVMKMTGLDFEIISDSLLKVSFYDDSKSTDGNGGKTVIYISLHSDNTGKVVGTL